MPLRGNRTVEEERAQRAVEEAIQADPVLSDNQKAALRWACQAMRGLPYSDDVVNVLDATQDDQGRPK